MSTGYYAELKCQVCGHHFDVLYFSAGDGDCPSCGSDDTSGADALDDEIEFDQLDEVDPSYLEDM